MKLRSTSDEELTKITALVIGTSGIGKTTSLGTLPEKGTVIACGERGMLPLRDRNYAVLPFTNWTEIYGLAMAFGNPDAIKDDEIKAVVKSATLLVVEGLSECSEMCIRHIVQVERRKLAAERSEGARDRPQGVYEEQMTMEDWGLYKTRMTNLMSALCHLPIHVIVTCLEGWKEDKKGGVMLRTVNLSGQAAITAPAYFDLVLHMEADTDDDGEPRRVWRTATDGEIVAKDGSCVLDEFEPTDWTKLFKKILKGGK